MAASQSCHTEALWYIVKYCSKLFLSYETVYYCTTEWHDAAFILASLPLRSFGALKLPDLLLLDRPLSNNMAFIVVLSLEKSLSKSMLR